MKLEHHLNQDMIGKFKLVHKVFKTVSCTCIFDIQYVRKLSRIHSESIVNTSKHFFCTMSKHIRFWMCVCACMHVWANSSVLSQPWVIPFRSQEPSAAHGKINLLIQYNNQSKDTTESKISLIRAPVLTIVTDCVHKPTHMHVHTRSCCHQVPLLDDSNGFDIPHRIWEVSSPSLWTRLCVCFM